MWENIKKTYLTFSLCKKRAANIEWPLAYYFKMDPCFGFAWFGFHWNLWQLEMDLLNEIFIFAGA